MSTYPDHGDSSHSEAQEIPDSVRSLLLKIGDLEELKMQLRDANQRLADLDTFRASDDSSQS